VAALRYRKKTGKGQYIDLSQLEAGLQFMLPPLLDYTVNGRQSSRMGNTSPCASPHGVYPCLGKRWCAIAVFGDEEWRAFCEAMGNPAWSQDPKFATFLKRKKNQVELDRRISEWTVKFSPEEVMALLQKVGISAGVVMSSKDLCDDSQLIHRNHFWILDHKEIGKFKYLGQAAILSKTPARAEIPSPCMGEHTEFICKQILNMSDTEFVELLNEGIFGI